MIKAIDIQKITQKYSDEIHSAVSRVIDSGWYLQGDENKKFEADYADYIETKYCVGCGNGLDALIWIFRAYIEMGVMKPGDEVIVPANTYIATILAITENGLVPVLIEPKHNTLEIDDDLIESHITPKTKAIAIVHLYGRIAYTSKIGELCKKYNLKLVEDCAQSHGCKFEDGRMTGNLGDAAGFSFYPGKNLGALGDGGAMVTNDETVIDYAHMLANYGMSKKYIHDEKGINSRLDELQAAVLRIKLKRLDIENNCRKQIAQRYFNEIRNKYIELPYNNGVKWNESVYHIFPILCSKRDKLRDYLAERGIETLIHYPKPPHLQRAYKEMNHLSFPVAEKICREQVSFPLNQSLREEE